MIGYIKWILMILGLSRGNIVGGFMGFILGYFIEEYLEGNLKLETKKIFQASKIKYSSYQKDLLALISEVVKADGYIHKEEVYYIKDYLLREFGSQYCNEMLKTLKLAVDNSYDIENICLRLKANIAQQKKINLLRFLYGISIQNGSASFKERILIENIAKLIGLSQSEYENIVSQKHKRQQNTTQNQTYSKHYNPYEVLGINASASVSEIKKAYRKMVLKYHPDKTDIDDKIANEKFSEISKAYHFIKQQRNIK